MEAPIQKEEAAGRFPPPDVFMNVRHWGRGDGVLDTTLGQGRVNCGVNSTMIVAKRTELPRGACG